ncbi:TPA: winged helix-turn-helix transcriptional regulator [archaeon]|uniref:Winged helix-turn-helix transcriptional regulator n=1 Tax=Candidatus Naiadarchaeum limnaeum TaxID=2756139 RepID=A0A832UMP8_9ARCH|nr:winged helix-turn-helix transcriptional regulator [Candidatus Naiadarchaeales archaeon SRR2090153.bin1042]HIK00029.1 winged helix-turn-helix transcriptional regulator [Candidatus Naiadarchaeum limnaeum]
MAFWDFLVGKKKARKNAMQRTIEKKKERKKYVSAEKIAEDPVISFSKQLTNVQRDVEEIQSTLLSGFKGLREDHHKIMGEQATKSDFSEFKKYLEEKKTELEKMRQEVDRELEMLDIDKKIVNLVERRKMRAAEVAKELKISRQYAAMRLSELTKYNVVEQMRKGREVYYRLKK